MHSQEIQKLEDLQPDYSILADMKHKLKSIKRS